MSIYEYSLLNSRCVTGVIFLKWRCFCGPLHKCSKVQKSPTASQAFLKTELVTMCFSSVLISIPCALLLIISEGSCGKCFWFSDVTFVIHLNHIFRLLYIEIILVVYVTLLKILIQQRCLLSSWLSLTTFAWETTGNLANAGNFAQYLMFAYVMPRNTWCYSDYSARKRSWKWSRSLKRLS